MRDLVHLLLVDSSLYATERACGARDGHQNKASTLLKHVTCVECLAAHYFPRRP